MSSPVFVSYASADQDIAETICDALQARGHPCWIACRNIAPGENFQEAIVKAIRSAKVMLLVFTSNANNSDAIKRELVLAGRHRVTVLPLRVEDVAPNDAFAYEFATRQWIDLFKDWEREIERLGAQIDALVALPKPGEAVGATAAATPTPWVKPTKPTRGASSLIAAAALVVAALGAGGAFLYTRAGPMPASPVLPPPAPAIAPPNVAAAAPPAVPPANTAPAGTAPGTSASPASSAISGSSMSGPVAAPVTPHPVETPSVPQPVQAAAPASPPQPPPAPPPSTIGTSHAFDGAWAITFSCPPAAGAMGYSYRVAADIKDGLLHGEKGVKSEPGWLTIDGKIGADGSLDNLYVDSLVGASAVAVGHVAKGTEFGYHIAGKLAGASGNAHRVEGRPCTLDFAKQ